MSNAELNRDMLQRFAAQFDTPAIAKLSGSIAVHPTDAINGRRLPDAFMMSIYDQRSACGIVAITWGKQFFKAFIEIVRSENDNIECLSSANDFRAIMAGQALRDAMIAFGTKLHGDDSEESNGPDRP
jgi:hypothetical protein